MRKLFALMIVTLVALGFVGLVSAAASNASGGSPEVTGAGNRSDGSGEGGDGTALADKVNTSTQNQGEGSQLRNEVQESNMVRAGNYKGVNGEQIQVKEMNNNRLQLNVNGVDAETGLKLMSENVGEGSQLKVELSNGRNAEVKIMPDVASETALEQLRLKTCTVENNCSLELKEVGEGQEVKAAYELRTQRTSKILGLFRARMQVQAQVDAENGEVVQVNKPWWAFLAAEPEE